MMYNMKFDGLANWEKFYAQHIQPPMSPSGEENMTCCCPFHKDEHPSFSFNRRDGLWHCFAGCGSGNPIQFLERHKGISYEEAYRELCAFAGIDPAGPKSPGEGGAIIDRYTVKEYAAEKHLPEDHLRAMGVTDGGKDGHGAYIKMRYCDEDGSILATRKRYHPTAKTRFAWMKGSKTNLYGLWGLDRIRSAGYVVLVEGESDTQALQFLGIHALGVPGACTFRAEWTEKLSGIPMVFLHIEPGDGGQAFLRKTALGLYRGGFQGTVLSFACARYDGCKDPSDLLIKFGEEAAKERLETLLDEATPLDLQQLVEQAHLCLTDPPVVLKVPSEWEVTDNGIAQLDAKTGAFACICWTPLLITRVLPAIGGGHEKVELAFRRGDQWIIVQCERTIIASSRNIVDGLANHGINVTSENARALIRYFSDLERENLHMIRVVPRITRYGWIDETHFAPGLDDGYYLDMEHVTGAWGKLGKARGDYTKWKEGMRRYRKHPLFRFMLSAAFASPLLKILGHRIFMIYNWGDSLIGKTATLRGVLSVWGPPEGLMITFNATQVGFEKVASIFSDLPLGINERQVAGDKQENLQRIVYMLSEGTGRVRSNKSGGLQALATWRMIVLMNGEESLSSANTMTGVSTRVMELYGAPFDSQADASAMYALTAEHHGHAGIDFIGHLISMEPGVLRKHYDRMVEAIGHFADGQSSAYIANTSLVALADYMASLWIWGLSEEEALQEAIDMGRDILQRLQTEREADVSDRAYQHIIDWVVANRECFFAAPSGKRYGLFDSENHPQHVHIIPSILEDELRRAGFAYMKTLRWLAAGGLIETEAPKRFTIRKTVEGMRIRVIRLKLPVSEEPEESEEEPPDFDSIFK